MRKVIELGEHDVTGTASEQGLKPIELSRIPATENGEPVYVREIFADILHTEIDLGAGGQAVTPVQLHNQVAAFTVSDGKKPWGPDKLTGSQLAAFYKIMTGENIPFQGGSSNEGDANIADTEVNEVRRIAVRYPYWALGGEEGDACPPAVALRKGHLHVRWAGFPTNMTKDLATVKYYAEIYTENELCAAPRVRTFADTIPTKKSILAFAGTLRSLILENSADWADADISRFDLKSDRGHLLENVAPLHTNFVPNWINPEITSARMQRHFCEPLGGTDPRFVQVFPFNRAGKPYQISKLPTSSSYKVEITGTEDPANIQVIPTLFDVMEDKDVLNQLAPAGCNAAYRQALEEAVKAGGLDAIGTYKTGSKVALHPGRSDLKGLLKFKLRDERLARLGGLQF